MWVPSDRTFGVVVSVFGILVLLLFFEPALLIRPFYYILDLLR